MTKKTILLIEDEADLCELLQDELSQAGYRVCIARNGEQGLEQIHNIDPDLILCDRAMPKMSGYDLLERIRGVYPQYSDIPFIFLTALADARDGDAVKHLKPSAYLGKPVDFDLLREEVKQALKNA
ncbi:MAG: response regulator [Pseudomonadota bacterium]